MTNVGHKECTFDGCTKKLDARGLCNGHYYQWRSGRQLQPLRGRSLTAGMSFDQRFWFQVNKGANCWIWSGTLDGGGYGYISRGGKYFGAHRISFELAGGELRPGMVVDHTCHTPACVNPDHLQAVTHKQNCENRAGAESISKSGVRGVFWVEATKRWQASVRHNGKLIHAGTHTVLQDAEAAVIALRNELFTNNLIDRKSSNA